ncbi:MAG: SDR family oxidoreductase [Lachnospiraceae bacterium]|nr:SDR family oxidoreductase [Lachnospiraceae bacterium]
MKTAVITGSTRGLGLEMAKQFRKKGFNVVICGIRQENIDKAISILCDIKAPGKIIGQRCNVSSQNDVENLAATACELFDGIDIWINNAGVNQSFQLAWDLNEEEIDYLLQVDLKGAINGTNAAMRKMISQGYGAIYNVEGMGSNDAFQPCFSLYGTAKRAVTYFTDAVANEIKAQKLPVLIGKLSPGIMITDFLTSSEGKLNQTELSEKTKRIYNILGDYPDVVAAFLVSRILKNRKNGARISWLTNQKAAAKFVTAGISKNNYFSDMQGSEGS